MHRDEERRAVNPNKTQTRVLRLWKTIAINFSIRLNYKTIYTLESNKSKVVSIIFNFYRMMIVGHTFLLEGVIE